MRQVRLCFSEIRGGVLPRPGRHARVKKDALHVDAGVAVEGAARKRRPIGEGPTMRALITLFSTRVASVLGCSRANSLRGLLHRDLQFVIPFAGRKPNHASRTSSEAEIKKALGNEPFVGEKLEGASLTLLEGVRYSVVYRYFHFAGRRMERTERKVGQLGRY